YDMVYLLEQGFKVIGVELSSLAIEQFFNENNLVFTINQTDQFTLYQGENITLYCGDYFALDKSV
ncbi:MAG TPA: thiopurine S-methyltransferase, partial [Gammaproteobacteria bacterium]|nr:thiopurine S-methyltransferase [Gammaproteobacteria bacterium]